MNILFVTPFDEPISGADESLLMVVEHLDRNRFTPIVLAMEGSQYADRYRAAGAEVVIWPLSRLRRKFRPRFWMGFLRRLTLELRDLPKLFRDRHIDVVHLNMHVCLGPMIAAHRAGIPVVVHYRAKTNDEPKVFFDLFLPFLACRAAAILCISEAVAGHFRRRKIDSHVEVVPNPIDLDRFSQGSGKEVLLKHPALRGKKIVLFVGRTHPQKKIDVFLRALAVVGRKYEDIVGMVVGDPAEEAEDLIYAKSLREMASASTFPVHVEFVPRKDDVAPYMAAASVFVLPSVNEGFGRVIIEAMASGIPVVGARSGAIPELIGEQAYGQLVPPDDPQALADAMSRALTEEKWHLVAEAAQVHVLRNFSVTQHVRRLEAIYDRTTRRPL